MYFVNIYRNKSDNILDANICIYMLGKKYGQN